NLATASPAGDALPPLVTCDASVQVASVRGERTVAVRDFFRGPKRSVLEADELIRAVLVPVATGPQQFAKVGTRNAMVIAVCSPAARCTGPGPSTGGRTDEGDLRGERRGARDRRRVAGREPVVRAARTARAAGYEERLRAGRVRFVLGLPRRCARLCVSGCGG